MNNWSPRLLVHLYFVSCSSHHVVEYLLGLEPTTGVSDNPAKLSLKIYREIRTFCDKEQFKSYVNTKSALQKLLKKV